jgi:hypothetical protein
MRKRWPNGISRALMVCSLIVTGVAPSFAQDVTYKYDAAGNLKAIVKSEPSNPGGPSRGGPMQQGNPPRSVQLVCVMVHCGIPDEPKLVSGRLHGHQVCGDFAGLGATYSFTCDPLASNAASGWQLTPLVWTNPDGKSHLNKAVVLTILTPTQTELYVEYENLVGTGIQQEQVVPQFGDAEVRNVGPNGQVAVVMSDDGTNRTWTLQFMVNTCADVAKVNIYDVGSSGTTNGVKSTNPLRIYILRDPAELENVSSCI